MKILRLLIQGFLGLILVFLFGILSLFAGVGTNVVHGFFNFDSLTAQERLIFAGLTIFAIILVPVLGNVILSWFNKKELSQVYVLKETTPPEITHDIQIFRKSEEIMSETRLRELFTSLYSGEFYRGQNRQLRDLLSFANQSGNSYLNPILRSSFASYKAELNTLADEMIGFFTVGTYDTSDNQLYRIQPTWRSHPDPEKSARWESDRRKIAAQVDKTEAKFEEYRALVKEILFI